MAEPASPTLAASLPCAIQLAAGSAGLDPALRAVAVGRDDLHFAAPPGTPPAQLLAVKHTLQRHVDLAARESELRRMSDLLGDRLVALLSTLGSQQIDETGVATMFDFLGADTTLAIRREGALLFLRGMDPHTLAIAQRRAATLRVHASAIGQGEMFTCRCDSYEGYFLRDQPFTQIERALVELHLNLMSKHLRQQALHQSLSNINELFAREYAGVQPEGSLPGTGDVDTVERNFTHLLEAALKDSLTQAYNRHKTSELLGQLCRGQASFSVVLLDIDHFKHVNDTHGHLAGDRVLVQLAQRVQSVIRDEDLLARWGGEEFLIIARGADAAAALALAERVRQAVSAVPSGDIPVTVSQGVAVFDGVEALEQLMARTDAALYEAKRRGRDCVVPARPGP